MNIKNFIIPLTLTLLTTWAFQYLINRYTGKESTQTTLKSGQTFVAPESQIETQPLNRRIDFVDQDIESEEPIQKVKIQTDYADYYFSNQGAVLQEIVFKRINNALQIPVNFSQKKELRPNNFLVAFESKTPLNYQLVNQESTADYDKIGYKATTAHADIEKEFIIYKQKFQIDVGISIIPKRESVQPRLFYAAPYMSDVKSDTISALFNTESGSIKKEARDKLDLTKGWFAPNFFGAENRYFVSALVNDEKGFARRAYFALENQTDLMAILEGPVISKPTQWNLSFFVGPKIESAMNIVDPRLKETLDYSGLLAPLSRVLLIILEYINKFLNNYGWSIILLTVLINLVLLPFSIKGAKSMKKSQEFHKKMAYIQQRYKNDPEALSREQAELFSKYGITGGMGGGCLIKFLQLPIILALGRLLSGSFELYKAPFLWINDLSASDPYYILPILIMLCMIFLSEATDIKQRFIMIAMALVLGAVAVNWSAGICLYILVGVILAGIQTWFQKKPLFA